MVEFLSEFINIYIRVLAFSKKKFTEINSNVIKVWFDEVLKQLENHVCTELDKIVSDGEALLILQGEFRYEFDKVEDHKFDHIMKVIYIASNYNINKFIAHKAIQSILKNHGMVTVTRQKFYACLSFVMYLLYPIFWIGGCFFKQIDLLFTQPIINQLLPVWGVTIPIFIFYEHLYLYTFYTLETFSLLKNSQNFEEKSGFRHQCGFNPVHVQATSELTHYELALFIWWLGFTIQELQQLLKWSSICNNPFEYYHEDHYLKSQKKNLEKETSEDKKVKLEDGFEETKTKLYQQKYELDQREIKEEQLKKAKKVNDSQPIPSARARLGSFKEKSGKKMREVATSLGSKTNLAGNSKIPSLKLPETGKNSGNSENNQLKNSNTIQPGDAEKMAIEMKLQDSTNSKINRIRKASFDKLNLEGSSHTPKSDMGSLKIANMFENKFNVHLNESSHEASTPHKMMGNSLKLSTRPRNKNFPKARASYHHVFKKNQPNYSSLNSSLEPERLDRQISEMKRNTHWELPAYDYTKSMAARSFQTNSGYDMQKAIQEQIYKNQSRQASVQKKVVNDPVNKSPDISYSVNLNICYSKDLSS